MAEQREKPTTISMVLAIAFLILSIGIAFMILKPIFLPPQAEPSSPETIPTQEADVQEDLPDLGPFDDFILIDGSDIDALISDLNTYSNSIDIENTPVFLPYTVGNQLEPALIIEVEKTDEFYSGKFITPANQPEFLELKNGIIPWQSTSPGDASVTVTAENIDLLSTTSIALYKIIHGEYELAGEILEDYRHRIPELPSPYQESNLAVYQFISALSHMGSGHQIDGLKAYSDAIRYLPDFLMAYINRGGVYLATGDETTATNTYNRALEAADDDLGLLHYNLAMAYLSTGDFDLAREMIDTALENSDTAGWARNLSGIINYSIGDFSEALAEFEEIETLESNAPILSTNRGLTALALENHEEASNLFQEAVNIRGSAVDFSHLASALAMSGDLSHAIDPMNEAILLSPENTQYILTRGRYYLTMGDLENSMADVESAIVIDPEEGMIYHLLGDIFLDQGEWNDARNNYSKAIDQGVENPEIYESRGWAAHQLRLTYTAALDYQRSIELGNDDPMVYYWMGMAYFDAGYITDALNILTTAANQIDAAEVNAALALALDAIVRRDEADQAYLYAIELEPDLADLDYLEELALWTDADRTRARSILRRLGYLD